MSERKTAQCPYPHQHDACWNSTQCAKNGCIRYQLLDLPPKQQPNRERWGIKKNPDEDDISNK